MGSLRLPESRASEEKEPRPLLCVWLLVPPRMKKCGNAVVAEVVLLDYSVRSVYLRNITHTFFGQNNKSLYW